jgi:hypothetical protein
MYQQNEATHRFSPGRIVATPGALGTISRQAINQALFRHLNGDWGDCCPEDRRHNDMALCRGERLMSVYQTRGGTKFWIITEADRSATTVLLPEEY